jgi:methylmalonyl-CoA epimerase
VLLTEIDHVAIAVTDLEAAIAWYEEVFGATVDHREVVDSDGVEEALLKVAESYVQLLTPVSDDSPVAKYLEKKGEGLHQRPPGRGPAGPQWPSSTPRAPSAP